MAKKQRKPVAFPFFADDWLSSPRILLMSLAEEGAYIRLLAHCWSDENCSLPDDDALLAVLARIANTCSQTERNEIINNVRKCFIEHPFISGRLTNLKMFELHREALLFREQRREAGVKSGKSRRYKKCLSVVEQAAKVRTSAEREAAQRGEHAFNSPLPSPSPESTNVDSPYKSPKGGRIQSVPKAFEAWWSTYPKKAGKQAALKAWTKAGKRLRDAQGLTSVQAVERMQMACAAFAASPKGRGEFCPHPATWLNQGRYEDDPSAWQDAPANGRVVRQFKIEDLDKEYPPK